ncbi:MAG: FG-GAP repeat protein [Candidatus Coatesbacteria bacterium]|nr:FG-GAP repeat protein [Candidatus Coatesbacteria bacterium]
MTRAFLLAIVIIALLSFGTARGDFTKDMSLEDSDGSFVAEVSGDNLGASAVGVGDVNGDGFEDFAVGAPYNDEGGNVAGQAYLIFGRESGWVTSASIATAEASFIGEKEGDRAGQCIAGAGDVNGDGYDDFLIGAAYNDEGSDDAGQAYLILGKAHGWAMDTSLAHVDASFIGIAETDYAGFSVSGAGDVNGDGLDDIVIGAPSFSNPGYAFLIFGKYGGWTMDTSLADSDASFIGAGEQGAGYTVCGAGDVNNDGFDDFTISDIYNEEVDTGAGQVYLILGKDFGWTKDASLSESDASYIGENSGDYAGMKLSGGGDLNDDGFDDFVIGSQYNGDSGFYSGKAYVIFGKSSGWEMGNSLADADASYLGEGIYNMAGCALASEGDVNGDNIDDLMIGASYNGDGASYGGQAYLIFGKSTGWSQNVSLEDSDASFLGYLNWGQAGTSVDITGDIQRDGRGDILIGATGINGGTVYLVFGEGGGPELSDHAYTPSYGRTDVDFTFSVHHKNKAGLPPETIEIYVNGTAHNMTFDSGTTDDGTYTWTGRIPEDGVAQYHFEATDSYGRAGRHPASGELDGPIVYDDYVPPTSYCTAPQRSTSSSIVVDYASDDDHAGVKLVTLYYRFNGGGFMESEYSSSNPAGSFSVELTHDNGVYGFYTIAQDNADNVEDPPGSPDSSTIYDNIAPMSSADAGIALYWNAVPIAVDFTAGDGLSGVDRTTLWSSFEGGSWSDSGLTRSGEAGSYNFMAPSGEGGYRFYTISVDMNGNVEKPPASADCNVIYDITDPQSSCACVGNTNKSTVQVDYSASDNYEVDDVSLWYSFNGGSWIDTGQTISSDAGSFTFAFNKGDGIYRFYSISRDLAGNEEDAPSVGDASVVFDQKMPESSCWTADYANSVPFTVQFTASDSGSGVYRTHLYYRYSGQSLWQNSFVAKSGQYGTFSLDPIDITPQFGDGEYEVMTRATDLASNQEAPPEGADDVIVLDRTPPVSSCHVNSTATSAATIDVEFSASDALTGVTLVQLFVSRNDSPWMNTGLQSSQSSGELTYDFAGLDGTFQFVTAAYDRAGNVEELTQMRACSLRRDTGLPVSTSTSPELSNDLSFEVAFEVMDEVSGAQGVELYVRFSTRVETPNSDDWEFTGLYASGAAGSIMYTPPYGIGIYEFFTIARDNSGNLEPMKVSADCVTDYNPGYVITHCFEDTGVAEDIVVLQYEADVGEVPLDHVELWYKHSSDGVTWLGEWSDSGLDSAAEGGALIFPAADGDGRYRFCTVGINEEALIEPFPKDYDFETGVDTTVPESTVWGPTLSGSSPVTLFYEASDAEGDGLFCSDVEWVEIWYSLGEEAVSYDRLHVAPAASVSGSIQFLPPQEGIYEIWSIAIDSLGNEEEAPETADLVLTLDLSSPISSASCAEYGTGFPVEVNYTADDDWSEVESVRLWVRYGTGSWEDSGMADLGGTGTFYYVPVVEREGTYQFYTTATDGAGHSEASSETPDVQTIIDWTAPQTSCDSPPYSNTHSILLSYTAGDAVSGVSEVSAWILTSGVWQDTGQTGPADGSVIEVDVSAWGEGTFGFCTRGVDNAGNRELLPGVAPTATIYDKTKPTSAAGLPSGGIYANKTPVSVPYTAHDARSGLDRIELWFRFGGGDWESSGNYVDISGSPVSTEGSFEFTPESGEGIYEFATRAADMAGNLKELPEEADGGSLTYDRTAPNSAVSYADYYASGFPLILQFVASDSHSDVASVSLFVSINGSQFSDSGLVEVGETGDFVYTPDVISDGVYRFYSIATDGTGNVEAAPDAADAVVVFDLIAPVSVADISADYSNSFPIQVSYTADDALSGLASVTLWVSYNGGTFTDSGLSSGDAAGTFDYSPASNADGTYEFYTRASDCAGNVEEAPAGADGSIVIDRARPNSSCSIADSLTNRFPIQVEFTSSDASSGVKTLEVYYRYNRGTWALAENYEQSSGTLQFTPKTKLDGYYEFFTKAYDKASNAESTGGADDSITVDTTPPASSAIAPSITRDSVFVVSFSASDDGSGVEETSLWYQHNGGEWLDYGAAKTGTVGQFDFDCPAGQGTYKLYTISTDIAGNTELPPAVEDGRTEYKIPAPDISTDKSEIDFDDVEVGDESSRSLWIANVGNADLTVGHIVTDDTAFTPSYEGSLPMVLSSGEDLEIKVVFAPDTEGIFEAELTIESDDPDTASLCIGLSGEGKEVAGEFVVEVSINAAEYSRGDTLEMDIGILNTDEPAKVDLYLVLTYDLGGPEERHWSASMTEACWADGISPVLSAYQVDTDFELEMQWWSSLLPCCKPMVTKSGEYMVRMVAFEEGTFQPISNISTAAFIFDGEPFLSVSTDKDTYTQGVDSLTISLQADLPICLIADVCVVLLTPSGEFWTPAGFGECVWVEGVMPIVSGMEFERGYSFSGPAFTAETLTSPPFDETGSYMLFAAFTETGKSTSYSDVGTAIFTME